MHHAYIKRNKVTSGYILQEGMHVRIQFIYQSGQVTRQQVYIINIIIEVQHIEYYNNQTRGIQV